MTSFPTGLLLLLWTLTTFSGCVNQRNRPTVTESDSTGVHASVRMELSLPETLVTGRDSIPIMILFQNEGPDTIRLYLMDNWTLGLIDSNNRLMKMEGGRDGQTPASPVSPKVPPGDQARLRVWGELEEVLDGNTHLNLSDPFGGHYRIGPIQTGKYHLEMTYKFEDQEIKRPSDVWKGSGKTPPVPVWISN